MKTVIAYKWYTLLLCALTGAPVPTHKELWQPARVKAAAPELSRRVDTRLRRYVYVFQGRATVQGRPSAGASVKVWLTSPHKTTVHGTVTDRHGNYFLAIATTGSRCEPVDWSVRAFTAASKPLELAGRRIAMRDDEVVVVNNPLHLSET